MSAFLPLEWEDKVNSPELLAFLQQYGEEHYLSAEEINQLRNGVNELFSSPSGGTSIGGTQCLIVSSFGTPLENGTALQAAYDDAKTKTPSATNVITVVATPGTYRFPASGFIMDTPYINLVSLDGNRSVVFDIDIADPFIDENDIGACLTITTDYVFVKGIIGKLRESINSQNYWDNGLDYILPIKLIGDFPNITIENCLGGSFSFGGYGTASGTFNSCVGGAYSFGFSGTASGTFNSCVGGAYSFGFIGTASGTFTYCTGGHYSFGAYGTASGTFKDCTGSTYSFGGGGTASGTFTNCTGSDYSFGGGGVASGTFTNCTGDNVSFGSGSGSGGEASGTFINCTGVAYSFGGNGGVASGTFKDCTGNYGSFGGGGTASGTFTNCIGSYGSFGNGGGTLSGKLFFCKLTSGTFQTVLSGGRIIYCIDGNNNTNNQ